MKVKEGDRVWLAEFDNGESVQPRQVCEVVEVNQMSWGTSIIVELDSEHRESSHDDGLREITEDQIESVIT